MSNEKPLHQVSAQGKIPRCHFHSVEHLAGTVTVQKFRKVQIQCRVRSLVPLTRSQCLWHVSLRLFLLSGAPHAHLASSWRRWHDGPPSPESSAASGPPVAADRGQERWLNAVPRRPALPGSPRGLMHASAPPLHHRRGPTALDALSAANGPAPSRSDQSLP